MAFEKARQDIEKLIARAEAEEIELAYVDEAGFSLAPPNRQAWSRPGQIHQVQPQKAGRLNVTGALLSSGRVFFSRIWETMTAVLFVSFLGLLKAQVNKPLVVILDNASIHGSKEILPMLRVLELQGLELYFIPPYSPELNRIEILWKKMKYEWIEFKKHSKAELEKSIENIESKFGIDYKMTFC